MKRLIILIVLFASVHSLPGVNDARAQAYTSGKLYVNAGVSFIYNGYRPNSLWYWNNYKYSFTPPLILSVEKGITDLFSAGVYATHRSYSWSYTTELGEYENSHTRMSFGGRFSFHYADLMNELLDIGIPTDKVDLYLTGILGLNVHKHSDKEPSIRRTTRDYGFFIGPILGARYMLSNNFGVYIEGGRGSLGAANLGITIKL